MGGGKEGSRKAREEANSGVWVRGLGGWFQSCGGGREKLQDLPVDTMRHQRKVAGAVPLAAEWFGCLQRQEHEEGQVWAQGEGKLGLGTLSQGAHRLQVPKGGVRRRIPEFRAGSHHWGITDYQ